MSRLPTGQRLDLADILDVRGREQLADFGFEIVAIDGVDLGCDLQRHPTALGYPDRLINGLFRRNAAEKGKVGRRYGLWRQKPFWQAVVNGADPAGASNGPPLGVRNGDHWDRGKGREDHLVLRQVESAMERGDEWYRLTGKQGKWIVIKMKVQQIEIMSPLANSLEHGDMQRIRVADRAVQTQCLRPTWLQVGRGLRIAAREQDNVMSERNQFVGQPRNNALGASIKLRRNGLSQRGYLRDLHAQSCLEIRPGFGGNCKASLRAQSRAGRHPTARQRETGLAQSEKRKLSCPQSVGLPPQVGARGGRPLPSHSTRRELLQSSAVGLAMGGRRYSVPPFE